MTCSLRSSAKVVLSTLLLKEVKFLKRLHSVDCKDELAVFGHTETSHSILQLNVVENHSGDIVGVLLSKSFSWCSLDLTNKLVGIVQNRSGNFSASISSSVISLGLGVADAERHVAVDRFEIGLDRGEESSLWVLLNLGGFGSS